MTAVVVTGWPAVVVLLLVIAAVCVPVWIGSLLLRDWLQDIVQRYEAKDAEVGRQAADDDHRCCALDEGHDGACEWICSDCGGTGRCTVCEVTCRCDDVVACDWCDGTDACPGCYEGRITEDLPGGAS